MTHSFTAVESKIAANAETDNDIKKLFPVLFMFLSFLNMIICLGLVAFVQHSHAYLACAGLYIGLILTEVRFRIWSPVSISMCCLYFLLTFLAVTTERYTGYAGIIIFSWLIALNIALLIMGRPFTTFYSSGRGMKEVHWTIATLWLGTYIASLLTSIFFIPSIAFLIIPYVLCISCGLLTIFLNLCWFGQKNGLLESFVIGDFNFRRMRAEAPDFPDFCRFYAQQIFRHGENGNDKSEAEIAAVIATVEQAQGENSFIFVAESCGEMVGCIRCVVDQKNRVFPLEKDMQLSLDPLRRFGRILYIGRLGILPAYRERPDVINGLFKCFVDVGLSKDVSFVVAAGFAHRLPTYLKLGFEIMFDRSDPRHSVKMSHGYTCYPVYLNFAKMIFTRSGNVNKNYNFSDFVGKYLVERWYKRNAIKNIFKPRQHWPWRLTLNYIRNLL